MLQQGTKEKIILYISFTQLDQIKLKLPFTDRSILSKSEELF